MKRYLFSFLTGVLLAGTAFFLWLVKPVQTMNEPLKPEAEIILIGGEKSDCILIVGSEHSFMIDTGLEAQADDILALCREKSVTKLDFLILTHFDKDHVGGAAAVLESLSVGGVFVPDYEEDNDPYIRFTEVVAKTQTPVSVVTKKRSIELGEFQFLLIPGEQKKYEKDNDYSLVTAMEYGETSFLFAGDIQRARLKELMKYEDKSFSFIKVPHHGIEEEGLTDWIDKFSPEALLVTGFREMFSKALRERTQNDDIPVYFTEDGDITIAISGNNVSLIQ